MSQLSYFDKVDFRQLQRYLDDEDTTDVCVKNKGEIWITSNSKGHYRLNETITKEEVERIIYQVANKMKKEFNAFNPNLEGDIVGEKVDYRIACVHQELAALGNTIAIRKIRKIQFLSYDKLVKMEYITKEALDFLIEAVKRKANILIIGETGSGKTELLKFLSMYIDHDDVVVTIEDSLEFNINQINPNLSCTSFRIKNGFNYSKIIAMALRLNVQRILLQEARSVEVNDLLDAMSTGHNVMTTMHAKDASAVPIRIKQMLKNENENFESLKTRIYSLIDYVITIKKETSGKGIKRYVDDITQFNYDPEINSTSEILIYKKDHTIKKSRKKVKE